MPNYPHTFLPYLLRATYDWLVDNNLIINIEINTAHPQVIAPSQYIENNRIVLDVSPQAVKNLKITNEIMEFEARFGEKVHLISTPINAITAIFNPLHGYGIKFQPEINIVLPLQVSSQSQPAPVSATTTTPTKSKPKLTLIKKPRSPEKK